MAAALCGIAATFIAAFVLSNDAQDGVSRPLSQQLIRLIDVQSSKRIFIFLGMWKALKIVTTSLVQQPTFKQLTPQGMSVLLVIGSLLCAMLFSLSAGSLAGACIALIGCVFMVEIKARHITAAHAKALAQAMPDVFRSLGMSLQAGKSLQQAIEFVATHADGVIAKAFGACAMRMRIGESTSTALEALCADLQAPGVDMLGCALLISQRTGAPLQRLFLESAKLIEADLKLRSELRIKTAQVKLSVKIVAALPAVILGFLSLISPEFRAGVLSPTGLICICIALILDVIALLCMKNIMGAIEHV